MKQLMTAVCIAGLMGASAAAQMPMDKKPMGQMDKGKMGKAITVTGCVAAGTDAEQFTLTNGMLKGETTGKSYDLRGGDLKAHVGHKVAVTGTMDTGMAGTAKMKPMEGDDMGEHKMAKDKMAKDKMSTTPKALRVTSVKMIAETCSN